MSNSILNIFVASLLTATILSPSVATASMGQAPISKVDDANNDQQSYTPKIDVVFVLDTTGSMSNLIEGAKQKIWSIATDILDTQSPADVRFGLIGYRDRGDKYVTRNYDLTEDIHHIYGRLLDFEANGGGDHPESVNQALYEAVHDMSWDDRAKTLRVVFLVGDAPPKMNYQQDVKYYRTANKAVDNDIIINTVLCGNDSETREIWKEIAELADGAYAAIPQSGGMQIIETPYDNEIQQLQREINDTVVPYGSRSEQYALAEKSLKAHAAPSAVSSKIAEYRFKKGKLNQVITGGADLVEDFEDGKVGLSDLKESELSDELRALEPGKRQGYIEANIAKRKKINTKLSDLVKKRENYRKAELAKRKDDDAFDLQVQKMIRKQAGEKGILYTSTE